MVTIHSDYQLKIFVNFGFLLCKQLCTFLAYDYVQTKDSQNETNKIKKINK